MQTPSTLNAMSREGAQFVCEHLATKLCGTERFKTELAELTGYTRPAVNSWFSDKGRPPTVVILYLQTELKLHEAEAILKTLAQAHQKLDRYRSLNII